MSKYNLEKYTNDTILGLVSISYYIKNTIKEKLMYSKLSQNNAGNYAIRMFASSVYYHQMIPVSPQ